MPQIHIAYGPDDEPVLTGEPVPDLGDMLIAPVSSEPLEPDELTPEQQRAQEFHEHAGTDRERLSLGEWDQPGRGRIKNATEVCQFGGWPRKHVTIGRHCPHGMLDDTEEITDGRTT